MVEAYIKYKPTENDTVKEIGEAVSKMYEVNQPKCHKFLIRKK
jgi:hypothetical protein